jgi:sugar-specific transcriptional regulator TrmB
MEKELQELGLGYYESKALNALLKERLNLRQLSKKSEIPFGKVYSVIKSLKQKNLIKETNTRPKLIYVENASEVISRLISQKKAKRPGFK